MSKGFNNQLHGTYTYRIGSINRKRQIIDAMMDSLHTQQMEYIDAAVEASDMAEAKTVIAHIMEL